MKISDAHCDTLVAYYDNPFDSSDAAWNIEKFQKIGGILQYMAICTDECFSGDAAAYFALKHTGNFLRSKPKEINLLEKKEDYNPNKINIVLALEGASPIVNSLDNLHSFYKMGVRAITLTWNHRNFLADGIDNDYGLTNFGKLAVKEMEKLGIIIDVSHLNERGFEDVLKNTEKPFMASHSNAKAIHSHRRNLHDEQIKEIIKRKGFIGINFYSDFLGNENDDLITKFLSHIEHILSLGGEDSLGMGADFDGMDKSPFKDVSSYINIIELLNNQLLLNDNQIEKIMFKNLVDFTLNLL
jgi:membrane dipeptidase